MKKIFKSFALSIALLAPSLAHAASSISAITPTPGSLYTGGNISVVCSSADKTDNSGQPYVYFSYDGKAEYEPQYCSSTSSLNKALEGYFYFFTSSNKNFYIKADADAMKAAGAKEFTITIKGWTINKEAVTCNLPNVTVDTSAKTITFKYKLVDDGGTTDPSGPSVPSNWIPLEWDQATSLNSGNTYYIVGKGGAATIETNSKEDLTMGGQLTVMKNNESEVALTSVSMADGNYAYNIANMEEDVPYTVVSEAFKAVTVTFKAGATEEVVNPENIPLNSEKSMDAKKVYYISASQEGTMVMTTDGCDPSSVTSNIFFTDANHTAPLTGVEAGSTNGNYSCSFPVEAGKDYYIYFTSPNYIVATFKFEEKAPELVTTPIEWDETVSVPKGENYFSFTGKGGQAHVVTNRTEDLTMGGGSSFYLFYGTDPLDLIDLTFVEQNAEGSVYNTGYLQEGQQYVIFVETFNAKMTLSVVEGLYVSAPVELTPNNETSLNASQVYYYTATEDCKVMLQTQTESSYFDGNNILWSDAAHSTQLSGVTTGSEAQGANFSFDLKANESFYVYFTYPNYVVATLSIVKEETPVEPTAIVEDELTNVLVNKLYSFTPSEDGTLTVTTNSNFALDFLYSDEDHETTIDYSGINYGDEGNSYTFNNLEADVTYYVYLTAPFGESLESVEMTFSMNVAAENAEINLIDPVVGGAFDADNYNYSNLTIVPGNVEFGNVTVEYWLNGDDKATVVDITPEQLGENMWGLPIKEAYVAANGNVAENTYFVVNIESLTYNGEAVSCDIEGVTVNENGSISYFYTVEAYEAPEQNEIGDAEIEATSLSTAEIAWFNEEGQAYALTLNDELVEEVEVLAMNADAIVPEYTVAVNEAGNALVITFDADLDYGTYRVYLPAGLVNVGDDSLNAMENLYFDVDDTTGISGIFANDGDVKVYNLQGVRVNKESLTNGLYIINGKKVMIRK